MIHRLMDGDPGIVVWREEKRSNAGFAAKASRVG
jgi:hypothetical protein